MTSTSPPMTRPPRRNVFATRPTEPVVVSPLLVTVISAGSMWGASFGVRIALGATVGNVVTTILADGMRILAIGAVVGVVGSMSKENLREGVPVEFVGGSMVGCPRDAEVEDALGDCAVLGVAEHLTVGSEYSVPAHNDLSAIVTAE